MAETTTFEPGARTRAKGVPRVAPADPPRDTPAPVLGQAPGVGENRLKTRTLIVLRLLGVIGQASLILFVMLVLRFPVPYLPCSVLVGASALLNLALMVSPASRRTAKLWEAGGQLGFDLVQIAGLLFFTGGVTNPFCVLMITPVTVAFATMPRRWGVVLAGVAAVLALILAVFAQPLPWAGNEVLSLPLLYRAACAVALIMGMTVIGGFAYWTALRATRMELALHVTETVLGREQRVSALGALAAAAAHELGSPLTTISVIAKEMAREAPEGPLREDAWLLMDEAQRCRGILKRLTDSPDRTESRQRINLEDLVDEIVSPFDGDPVVRVEPLVTGPPDKMAPDVWRRTEIVHAMNSIVENAFDFAESEILVTARFDAKFISLEVADDGPGFSQEILDRLGDPYVTSRPGAEGSRTGHVGMGLGFFIAKTLLERTDGRVEFRNGRRRGAIVKARWRREALEAAEG